MALLLLALLPLTIALAQPSRDVRVPRNRAVIMLVIDVSQSMMATDVPPNRLVAAKQAAQQFAEARDTRSESGPHRICGNRQCARLAQSRSPGHCQGPRQYAARR